MNASAVSRKKVPFPLKVIAGAFAIFVLLLAAVIVDSATGASVFQRILFTQEQIAAGKARRIEQEFIEATKLGYGTVTCPKTERWAVLEEHDKARWHRYWEAGGEVLLKGTIHCYVTKKLPDEKKR